MKCQRNHGNQIEEEIESENNYDIRQMSDCFEAVRQCLIQSRVICSSENLPHRG